MPLSPTEKRALMARAHALDPVVMIGSSGLTPAVLKEIDVSLKGHELIKVKAASADRETRALMMSEICGATGAEPVQSIGRMLVLYRKNPEPVPRPAKPKRKPARPLKRSFQNEL